MIRLAPVVLIAVMVSLPLAASPILHISDINGNLGTVDVATGSVNVIGSLGVSLSDIAFDSAGNLYGVSFTDLYSINPFTAQTTLIGALGLATANNALVFHQNGTLYGANQTTLYTVNTLTGAGTVIGPTGFASAGDLAFHQGNLYLAANTHQLIQLNTATGAGTVVGSFGFSNVFGMAEGSDTVLYGVAGTQIFRVDPVTGAGTLVVDYGGQGLGLAFGASAFIEAPPAAVPEPSTLSLSAAMLLLAAFNLRKRRRA